MIERLVQFWHGAVPEHFILRVRHLSHLDTGQYINVEFRIKYLASVLRNSTYAVSVRFWRPPFPRVRRIKHSGVLTEFVFRQNAQMHVAMSASEGRTIELYT